MNSKHLARRSVRNPLLAGLAAALVVTVGLGGPARAAEAPVGLGTAANFAVLAGATVTNTGASELKGFDLGVSPGSAITGFPPGIVDAPGAIHAADATASRAQSDTTTAFNDAAGRTASAANSGLTDLVGLTLQPGVYQGDALSLGGTVTLDNNDVPDAVFIFQAASTLITSSSSVVTFTNADHPSCNVFWEVGSSATLGTNSSFVGSLLAHVSITAGTGATVQGRLLAGIGQVSLDDNVITRLSCAPPSGGSTTTASTSTSAAVTTTPVSTTPPVTTAITTGGATGTTATRPPTTPAPRDTVTLGTLPIIVPSGSSTAATNGTNGTNGTSTGTSASAGSLTTATTLISGTLTTETLALGTGGQTTGLAITGPPEVTGLTITGLVALLSGGVLTLFVGRRRSRTPGQHRA